MLTSDDKRRLDNQLVTMYEQCTDRIAHFVTPDARYRTATSYLATTIDFWDLTGFDGRPDGDRRDARAYLGAMACLDVALACHGQDVRDALKAAISCRTTKHTACQ